MGSRKPDLATTNISVSLLDIRFPFPDGFDFGSHEGDPGLYLFQDLVVETSLAVFN
jgi:hypothetical protein